MTSIGSRPRACVLQRLNENEIRCIYCGEAHPATYSHCPKSGRALSVGRALIGRVFANRYKIISLIGEGGMGTVYLAEHMLIGRQVALKNLHPELASDAKAVARFQLEARTAAATRHENVVEILDLGYSEDGTPFLVMEYLRGQTLASTLRREKRLAPARAGHIVGQVLAALSAVHRRGIIHRDLKPENVFLLRRAGHADHVKVLDFGVSKIHKQEREPLGLTRTGVMLGTPSYMSPEQARGVRELDHRVDLYAAGVILYESLSGRQPFEGQNYHALLQSILAGTPRPIDELVPGLDPRFTAAVHRSIARDPAQRFQTAREMLLALIPFGAIDTGTDEPDSIPPEPVVALMRPTSGGRNTRGDLRRENRSHASVFPPPPSPVPVGPATERDLSPMLPTGNHGVPANLTRTAETNIAKGLPPNDRPAPRPRNLMGGPRHFVAASEDWNEGPFAPRAEPPLPPSPLQSAFDAGGVVGIRTPPLGPANPSAIVKPPSPDLGILGSTAIPSVEEAQVRGSFVLAATDYVRQSHGNDSLQRIFSELPPEARSRVQSSNIATTWLPVRYYDAVLRTIDRFLGRGDGSIANVLGAAAAEHDLPGSLRAFLHVATPSMAAERIPLLWRIYHSGGHLEIEPGTNSCQIEVVDLVPDTFLHAMAMAGFYKKMLELAGARDVAATLLSSRGRGEPRTVTSLRWT